MSLLNSANSTQHRHDFLGVLHFLAVKHLIIQNPSTPHLHMVSALELVLVFPTNSALNEFLGTIANHQYLQNIIGGEQRLLVAVPDLLRHFRSPHSLVMRRVDHEQCECDSGHSFSAKSPAATGNNAKAGSHGRRTDWQLKTNDSAIALGVGQTNIILETLARAMRSIP